MKHSQIERLAREYVANGGDAVDALRKIAPAMAGKTDAYVARHFARMYEDLPDFWRRVEVIRKVVLDQIALSAQDVLTHWATIATADASKISRVVVVPCLACWKDEPLPHPRIPNGKCPLCQGDGFERVQVTPTHRLGPAERLLYDGAEQTKNGIKVTHRSRDQAVKNIAHALGMFTERVQIGTIAPPIAPPLPDDPAEASKTYANWIKGIDK